MSNVITGYDFIRGGTAYDRYQRRFIVSKDASIRESARRKAEHEKRMREGRYEALRRTAATQGYGLYKLEPEHGHEDDGGNAA